LRNICALKEQSIIDIEINRSQFIGVAIRLGNTMIPTIAIYDRRPVEIGAPLLAMSPVTRRDMVAVPMPPMPRRVVASIVVPPTFGAVITPSVIPMTNWGLPDRLTDMFGPVPLQPVSLTCLCHGRPEHRDSQHCYQKQIT